MLRASTDVREAEFFQNTSDRHLIDVNCKALFDDPPQINAPPANHPVLLLIGASLLDVLQLFFLLD